jgi:hypothetical protein
MAVTHAGSYCTSIACPASCFAVAAHLHARTLTTPSYAVCMRCVTLLQIMDVVERFATDKRWRIDTLIALLGIAGDQAADAIPCATIIYIGQCEEYQVHPTTTTLTTACTLLTCLL